MEKVTDLHTKKKRLMWLMTATLVLGLIAFAALDCVSKPYNSQPARTELKAKAGTSFKRTACFKTTYDGLRRPLLQAFKPTDSFAFCLFQYAGNVTARLKSDFTNFSTI